jgi:hypothetical protein
MRKIRTKTGFGPTGARQSGGRNQRAAVGVLGQTRVDEGQQGDQRVDQRAEHARHTGLGDDGPGVDAHAGRGQGALHHDRRPQADQARLLGFAIDTQVEGLGAQIDDARAARQHRGGVDDEGLGGRLAVGDAEVGDSAADFHLGLVAAQKPEQPGAGIDAQKLGEGGAHPPLRHDHGHLSFRGGGEVMDRGAGALQPRPTQGAAGHGRRAAPGRNDGFQRIAPQTEVDGAVGHVAFGVDARRAAQLAPIEGEGDRVQVQDGLVQIGAQLDLADVQFVSLHLGGGVFQRAVHGAQTLDVQRGVGQQPARLAGRDDRIARRGHGRRAAQNRGQVLDVQQAGMHHCIDPKAIIDPVDHQIAGQVRRPDPAAEIIEAVFGVVPRQPAGQAVGRRIGRGDAGQQVEVGQVATLKAEGGLELAQIERPGDRAARFQT